MIYLHMLDRDKLPTIENPDTRYLGRREESWLRNERVQEFAKEIDGATYFGNYIFVNREGLPITDDKLSTGFKMLTMLEMLGGLEGIYLTSRLGDNCWKFVKEITDRKDIHMFYCSVIPKLHTLNLNMVSYETGKEIHGIMDILDIQEELGLD